LTKHQKANEVRSRAVSHFIIFFGERSASLDESDSILQAPGRSERAVSILAGSKGKFSLVSRWCRKQDEVDAYDLVKNHRKDTIAELEASKSPSQ
jgi:hypothetical protein